MANVSPTQINQIDPLQVQWAGMATADTPLPYALSRGRGLAGAVQFSGTITGACTLEASEDGVTFFPLDDLNGLEISLVAAGRAEFTTAAALIRPSVTGSGITCTVTLRG